MTAVAGLYSFFTSASRSGLMSHRCNLSTSAERDSVSARSPPIQPTPITAASTVFTARSLPGLVPAHNNHDAARDATLAHAWAWERGTATPNTLLANSG